MNWEGQTSLLPPLPFPDSVPVSRWSSRPGRHLLPGLSACARPTAPEMPAPSTQLRDVEDEQPLSMGDPATREPPGPSLAPLTTVSPSVRWARTPLPPHSPGLYHCPPSCGCPFLGAVQIALGDSCFWTEKILGISRDCLEIPSATQNVQESPGWPPGPGQQLPGADQCGGSLSNSTEPASARSWGAPSAWPGRL